ncbi:hypothetical protein EME01_58450 [Sinorhizobium meliloti]|nr:hypothetical protein EME01_58450 [Sinorhizobium meliloti]
MQNEAKKSKLASMQCYDAAAYDGYGRNNQNCPPWHCGGRYEMRESRHHRQSKQQWPDILPDYIKCEKRVEAAQQRER